MNVKFILKQYIKSFMQNVYLPSIYKSAAKSCEVDKTKIILADMHNDTLPAGLDAINEGLKKRRFEPVVFCKNEDEMTYSDRIKFMKDFMKEYASAGYVFIENYFLPVSSCRKRKETRVIQLWHSGGLLKKMGYDTNDDIPWFYIGKVTANYDLVTVSSEICVRFWEKAFRLKKGTAKPLGLARTDRFFDAAYNYNSIELFDKYYPEAKGKKVILYVPSFSGNAAMPKCVGIEQGADKLLQDDERFYVITRLHPNLKKVYPEYFDERFEVLPTERLLPVADILITDYSSILFDYSLYKKPFILFCPDLDEYKKKRGFYTRIEHFPAPLCRTMEELEKAVLEEKYLGSNSLVMDRFYYKYMGACDGNSVDRILEEVFTDTDSLKA